MIKLIWRFALIAALAEQPAAVAARRAKRNQPALHTPNFFSPQRRKRAPLFCIELPVVHPHLPARLHSRS